MRIERAELRLIRMPLKFAFETSFGVTRERTILLVTLFAGGLEGYGECVAEESPLYREETVGTARSVLEEVILPRLLRPGAPSGSMGGLAAGPDIPNPETLAASLASVRGNRMAKAAVETAFWDLWAKSLGLPLWQLLGGVRQVVPVGVSLGIQPSVEATLDAVARYVAEGYRRIKLKIKPGWDVRVVAAVRERFPEVALTVDANSAYTLADFPVLTALDRFALDYIEQPLAYDDLHDHALLQARLGTPICLDESITSAADARKALAGGACRVINIKVGRVGGHLEARRVHDVAAAFGAPVWCGGMLEAGIGRAHNLHVATLANFTMPGDVASSSRYWEADIIEQPLEAADGLQRVPGGPGLGVTLNRTVLERVTLERRVVTG
ncbi:o-succinylbenzoate synthase [Carboxydochorda subterranea]|uniref:o-succinylbenzoate synthase n=1 Tax=Carboxydichorda subterranea TaxID=3109565 RepID=A0ABZ1BUW0_9FIRM|nr:o-succinylbenzoate synthase [Limnochorda sp. L945t]WRP16564.1 o-succinylbenzoate synthase [Limnochorda sp. L945t]